MMVMSMGVLIIGLFIIVAVLVVIGIVIGLMVKGALKRSKTGMSSVAGVYATVVSRRTEETGRGAAKYFVTFEMESGQRMELDIKDKDYDALVENQKGKLTYNGTRFNRFEKSEG